jgi:anti-anti-sigma factor
MDISPLGERLVKVTIAGRLDTQGVDRVETRLLAALVPGANNAIIDLSQVDFVASMGIRMLVSAARSLRSRQAALAVFGVSGPVSQVFEAVLLQKIIPVCSTEAEALAAIDSSSG